MAVVLGGSSARERGEEAAQLMLGGFTGQLHGSGQSLATLANRAAACRPTCGR